MTSERDELCPGSSGKSRKMKQGTIIFLRKVKIIFLRKVKIISCHGFGLRRQ